MQLPLILIHLATSIVRTDEKNVFYESLDRKIAPIGSK